MSSPEIAALFDRHYSPDHPELGSGPLSVEPYVSAPVLRNGAAKDIQRRVAPRLP